MYTRSKAKSESRLQNVPSTSHDVPRRRHSPQAVSEQSNSSRASRRSVISVEARRKRLETEAAEEKARLLLAMEQAALEQAKLDAMH
ncbi:hypothetical protein JYU34_010056 [Plutella xylostella]|uniref:Uncharacterized protein n=1 Tax=Plutella xylostella TaxID=51655 RepID=A0ABQ7QHJ6_PLUXY|nr:hypothetical protein JYU34_010056 [Plutella xylostella]